MSEMIYPVCVIGGGSAGTMAVLRTVLNNDDCLFFPGSPRDKKRSRALWVRKVENVPGHHHYKRGIEEPNSETLKWISQSEFSEKLHLQRNKSVLSVKKDNELFVITDNDGEVRKAKFVILCTGVMDVQPSINGTIETVFDYANAQTIDYCLICDGHHVLNKRTVVIGHDNGTAWVAIMLKERYNPPSLTILTNGQKTNFAEDTSKLLTAYKIEANESIVSEILGEEKGKVLRGFKLSDGKKIESDVAFVSMGMLVYNDLAKQLGAELDDRGFVKTNESGESSVSGLYVAGDLRANTRKQIYTAWDTAVTAVTAVNQKLRISRREEFLRKTI